MIERWAPIPGHLGYEVSDQGKVRSFKRTRPRILKATTRKNGYLQVALCDSGVMQMCYVHGLVMLAFIGPRPDGYETRHLDGDRTNNCLANLAYGTRSENQLDSIRHGTHAFVSRMQSAHCQAGHAYNEHARIGSDGHRRCRECERQRWRTWVGQNRAKRTAYLKEWKARRKSVSAS